MIRRHRAIWQADSARDFSSRQGLKSAGIVCISSFSNYRIGGKDPAKREDAIVRCCRKKKERSLSQCCSDLEVASNGYLQIFYISVRISSTQKSEFIVLPLEKPCNIRRFRLSNPQTVCTFPCFFPYGLKQGKDFYSPLTTLSSSRAELRFASLVEWA